MVARKLNDIPIEAKNKEKHKLKIDNLEIGDTK